MFRKSSFNPKYDPREKWFDATFKVHKTSARKVLTGIKILYTVLWLFWLSLLAGSLSLVWAFPVFDLTKNAAPMFELREIWISECFFPDACPAKLVTLMFGISKLFWQKLQYACHLLCILLSQAENLLSLNEVSLNIHLFLVFADILY